MTKVIPQLAELANAAETPSACAAYQVAQGLVLDAAREIRQEANRTEHLGTEFRRGFASGLRCALAYLQPPLEDHSALKLTRLLRQRLPALDIISNYDQVIVVDFRIEILPAILEILPNLQFDGRTWILLVAPQELRLQLKEAHA